MRTSVIFLSTTRSALIKAASNDRCAVLIIMEDGMSSSSRSRRSISKRAEPRCLEVDPAVDRSQRLDDGDDLLGVLVSRQTAASTPANCLNSAALPPSPAARRPGRYRRDRVRRPVGHHATVLRLMVSRRASSDGGDGQADRATPVVSPGQVAGCGAGPSARRQLSAEVRRRSDR